MSDPLEYETASPPTSIEPPPGAMAAIFLIVLSDLLGFGLIIPALPFYARQFHASDVQVGFIFSIYSLCQLIASPILGLASDKLGRRPVLIFSQLGSVIGFLVLAMATARQWVDPLTGLLLVYAARVIDGFSGGNISAAQAYISDVTSPQNRSKAMGMLGAAFGIGFSIGPAIGGLLARMHPSLPALFAAAFSFVAAMMSVFRLAEPARHSHAVDDETLGWLHPRKFLPILQNGPLVQLLGISFFMMMGYVMLESVFAIFANDRFGFHEAQVGGFFAFVGVIIVAVQGGLIGPLTRKFGEWKLAVVGPVSVCVAMMIYVFLGRHGGISVAAGVAFILVAGFFNAAGRSIQTPTISSLISQSADARLQGTTFGLFHMLGSLARVIGPVVATVLYSRHITGPFWLAAVISLGVAFWTIGLSMQRRRAVD